MCLNLGFFVLGKFLKKTKCKYFCNTYDKIRALVVQFNEVYDINVTVLLKRRVAYAF